MLSHMWNQNVLVRPSLSRILLFKNHTLIRTYAISTIKNRKNKKRQIDLKPLTFTIPNYISVDKLSNLLNCRISQLINDLTSLGFQNITHNYILSKEYVELILQEYNYKLPDSNNIKNSSNVYDELKQPINPKILTKRSPVVTIMGHIDHGKTTIIDYLRKSSVVQSEHGGITQHIGAFQIITPISKKSITFLDTPGHSAFLKMRERGANITDIIILVVSIEDSIMPQTLEAIKHIKNSGNQLIVAVTKIDKYPQLNERQKKLDKVLNDLIIHGIEIEKIGGDVQVIPISAKNGENMDLLEESIITLSEIMDIKAENSKNTLLEGWILESKIDKLIGNVATVLIKKGTLTKSKILICGNTYAKVKSIINDKNKQIVKALPSEAVAILGWKELPNAGDEVIEVKSESIAKKYIAKKLALLEIEKEGITVEKLNEQRAIESSSVKKTDIDEDDNEIQEDLGPKNINFIVKADVSGSVEAIKDSIASIGNDEVKCNIISSTVGLPNENDLRMAQITNSKILCFNLGSLPNDIVNNKEKVDIRQYNVIYKLIEDVTEVLTDNLKPIYENKILANADLREIFEFSLKKKIIKIAGCRITNGKINRNSLVQITRGEKIVYDGKLSTLKQGKEDIMEVSKGKECGMTFENNFEDYKAGDKILVYEKVKIQRYL